jgi:hypothetical protein
MASKVTLRSSLLLAQRRSIWLVSSQTCQGVKPVKCLSEVSVRCPWGRGYSGEVGSRPRAHVHQQMSNDNTIPRPRQPPRTTEPPPVPLLPLGSPPEPLRYPTLPCPPRDHRFSTSYDVTTHIVPAAFPRSSPFVALPEFPGHETKDERAARIRRYTNELLALQAQHVPDGSGTQPRVLWSVLNRYVRKGGGGGLTLLMLHANGLHKEVSVITRLRRGGFAEFLAY